MTLSKKDWDKYIEKLSRINNKASELIIAYVDKHGLDDVKALVDYAYQVAVKYGTASASLNALMYDTIAELEGVALPSAELAEGATYGDVAQAVQGTLKTSVNPGEIGGAVSRLVKRTGQDTMLENAIRDRAEFAWVPVGKTCAFCITLGSRGWQTISPKALKNGHAEHIHANCDCSYMVRHSENFNVAGYHPEEYLKMYYDADGEKPKDRINAMRRDYYQANREEILKQEAENYKLRQENTD